jgi:uncharacterized protein with HEPN domain
VVKAIELIGEQAWELRKAGVDLGRAIPLAEIAGMRHRLVHHYEGVDWNVVEAIPRDDIPALVENLGRRWRTSESICRRCSAQAR